MCTTNIDSIYSDLNDLQYRLCMEHNRYADKIMEHKVFGSELEEALVEKRLVLDAAIAKINEASALLRSM